MAIVLTEYEWPATKVVKSGAEEGLVLSAGKWVKIETSPDGEEILNEQVPAGKVWTARIIVEFEETDA